MHLSICIAFIGVEEQLIWVSASVGEASKWNSVIR
jgi:hypothetical protein